MHDVSEGEHGQARAIVDQRFLTPFTKMVSDDQYKFIEI